MTHAIVPADYRTSHLHRGDDYDHGDRWSPFDAFMARHEAAILGRIVPRYFPTGIRRYLDFACGTGRITQLVEGHARESFGIDISPSMLQQARAKCTRTTFLECDATVAPPPIGPVQLITSFRFFGHAQDELRLAALRAIRGLIAPDGYLIFNNHCSPSSINNLLLRLRGAPLPYTSGGGPVNLTQQKVKQLLAATGFRLVRSHGIGLWVIRAAFMRDAWLNSRTAKILEPLSRLPFVAPYCPDAILVARPS